MARATADAATERFTGFPDGGVQFFLELQSEQSRAWFKTHQTEFERLWRRPLELFVADLTVRLTDVYPGLEHAAPHFFRIQRDTRFARDKTPYKTYVAADVPLRAIESGDEEAMHATPGLYCSFGLEGSYIGMGAWHLSAAGLQRYRAALDHPRHGPRLQSIIDDLLARGYSIESMDMLKRVPPPYAQDHPRGELLKRKGLAVGLSLPEELCATPELVDFAATELRRVAPLATWLDTHLAPR